MMKNKEIFIGALILVFSMAFIKGVSWFFNISPDIWVGLIAGLSPYGVTVYLQKRKEEREHYDWLLRNKEACLTEMVDVIMSLLHDVKKGKKIDEDELLEKFQQLQPAMMLWGEPSVIDAWGSIQQSSSRGLEEIIRSGERLFRAIRKELGVDDSSLKLGELWAALLKPEDKQTALDACNNEVYE